MDTNNKHRSGRRNRSDGSPSAFAAPWDYERICEALRALDRQEIPLFSRSIRKTHSQLYAAARHWYGSYSKAITAAGFNYKKIRVMEPGRWNKKTVGIELRRLHRQKVPLHHAAIERERGDLVLAAYRYFGSYGKAVEAAGLHYDRIRVREMPSWDKKRIINRLKQFKEENHGLWKRSVREDEPYLERAARRCFGSYARAAREAGIDKSLLIPPPYRFWSPEKIVGELRALHAKKPSRLKPARLIVSHPRLLRACRRRFSTYKKALDAAGIPYSEVARVTAPSLSAEQIIAKLQELFEKGKDLRYSPMARNYPRILNASRTRFGTYEAAMQAAHLDYPPMAPIRHWTASVVIKTLRELNRRKVDLRLRNIKRTHLPLYEAARHYFGNYLSAVREAGIDYDAVVSSQLKLLGRRTQGANLPKKQVKGGDPSDTNGRHKNRGWPSRKSLVTRM